MITTEELAFWIDAYKKEEEKNLSLEQLISRLERAGTFFREKFIYHEEKDAFMNFYAETALTASVTAYLIAEKLKS